MNIDSVGVVHEESAALNKLSAVSNAPIFTFADTFFRRRANALLRAGSGQDCGCGPSHSQWREAQRHQESTRAIRIPEFDWRQMQRWGISESSLPPGSRIDFRQPTMLERYWWQSALITAIIFVQTGLIAGLLREHRRRQLAEVQSRQRMAELAHVNRFSTAGELTASIAHEINQPLGSILANAETAKEILKSPRPDIAELNEIVDDILHDDRRATEVIRRMRSLLKKAPFEQKQFDLNEVVQETIRFLSSLAVGRKFELVSVITPEALPVIGDRIQLQQVILNLVVNGIDAMRDTPSQNRIISIRTSRVDNFAQLSVSDRGSGIPDEKLNAVFEPFFTSKAEGMGMGLSIARTIIEAHNGVISAKNRDHGDAPFRIRLPLVSQSAMQEMMK
jgi:signal transduction histidine kinase